MRSGRRGIAAARAAALAALMLANSAVWALAGDATRRHAATARAAAAAAAIARGALDTETVSFADSPLRPVRVLRGPGKSPPPPASEVLAETVRFGEAQQVTVLRGGTAPPARVPNPRMRTRSEMVSFSDPLEPAVMIVRGIPPRDGSSTSMFGPASGGELDRVAFAVDGVESRHGADPRMWRPEPDGPQGPMQVGAKAAFDVGGGNRFDLQQNRRLGRAYLAQMFLRYGNWADALAAYNWGPGNLDQWIAGGRRAEELPLDVVRYVAHVLRDAVITGPPARF